jgi:hypothetical protein
MKIDEKLLLKKMSVEGNNFTIIKVKICLT